MIGTALDVAMTGLTKSMEVLTGQLKEAIAFADKAQRASLALGSTYEETRVQLGGTMEGLRGDINQRFGAAIAGLEAGLQGNTAGVAKLINQQQLTGTSFAKTAGAVATLEAELGLSRNDTNLLSKNLIQTGADYTISTDKLVGAIDALKATFPAQKLAGMGAEVMEAVTMLQGELGPQLAGPLQNVMKMVMDSSIQGYERLQTLGIEDVRGRLVTAKSSVEAQQILKDAFVKASDNFKSISGGVNTSFLNIAAASETFGAQTIEFTTIADNLGKRIKKEDQDLVDFGKTLANLRKEALTPFQEAFSLAYPFLLEAVDLLSAIANSVGQRFKDFAESLGGEKGAAATMKSFKLAVLDFAVVALDKMEGAFDFAKRIITEVVPNIFNKFAEVINNFAQPGGTLDYLKLAFSTLTKAVGFTAAAYGSEEGLKIMNESIKMQSNMMFRIEQMEASKQGYGMGDPASQAFFFKLQDQGLSPQKIMEKMDEFQANPEKFSLVGQLKGMADLSFGENAKRSPMYAELKALRDSTEADKPLARRTNRSLDRLNRTQDEINRKTPEISTSPEFLDETANMLGRTIEGILGIGRDSTAAEMLEELRIANEQRANQTSNSLGERIPTGN